MNFLINWTGEHRQMLVAIAAILFWAFANFWYFRRDIERWRRGRKPHGWSVDMGSKTSKGGSTLSH